MIRIERYSPIYEKDWDEFVDGAKNATFLFFRKFMDYHADRFQDHSLIIFDDDKIAALLPANEAIDTIWSHQGLSYGGLVLSKNSSLPNVLNYFYEIKKYYRSNNFNTLIYKSLPSFYSNSPALEETYALFRLRAEQIRVEVNSIIDLKQPFTLARDRKRMVQLAKKNGLEIKEEAVFEAFWEEILIPTRWETHKVVPAHSVAEINLLQSRFPNNIKQFNIYHKNQLLGGGTIFFSGQVIHTQYIASNNEGKKLGAADLLVNYLIEKFETTHQTISFGISTDTQGQRLNEGLLYWKNGFGATVFPHYTYKIDLSVD